MQREVLSAKLNPLKPGGYFLSHQKFYVMP